MATRRRSDQQRAPWFSLHCTTVPSSSVTEKREILLVFRREELCRYNILSQRNISHWASQACWFPVLLACGHCGSMHSWSPRSRRRLTATHYRQINAVLCVYDLPIVGSVSCYELVDLKKLTPSSIELFLNNKLSDKFSQTAFFANTQFSCSDVFLVLYKNVQVALTQLTIFRLELNRFAD